MIKTINTFVTNSAMLTILQHLQRNSGLLIVCRKTYLNANNYKKHTWTSHRLQKNIPSSVPYFTEQYFSSWHHHNKVAPRVMTWYQKVTCLSETDDVSIISTTMTCHSPANGATKSNQTRVLAYNPKTVVLMWTEMTRHTEPDEHVAPTCSETTFPQWC